MEPVFIEHIHINHVRHLSDVDIPLSSTERKHLILTGKNGSGKTSTLLEIRNSFKEIEKIDNYVAGPIRLKRKRDGVYHPEYPVFIDCQNEEEIHRYYQSGLFITAFFEAKRAVFENV